MSFIQFYGYGTMRFRKPVPDLAPEICWQIFDNMSPIDRIKLSRTSRSWRAAFEPYHLHLLKKFLLRYFPASPPAEFRALQKQTGMVISGSAVIQVLANTIWGDSDLDLYVEHSNAEPVAAFVLSQWYIFQPSAYQVDQLDGKTPSFEEVFKSGITDYDFGGLGGIAAVYTFTRGARKVQVISTHCPVLKLILMFHSTVVMNLITHSTIYALYPHATFQSRLNLHLDCGGDRTKLEVARTKYEERGWTGVSELYPNELLPTLNYHGIAKRAFSQGARWLGDKLTLSIQLDGTRSSPTRDRDFDSWALEPSPKRSFRGIPVRITTHRLGLPSSKAVCVFDYELATVLTKIISGLQETFRCSAEEILREVVPFYCKRHRVQTSALDKYDSEYQRIIVEAITRLATVQTAKEKAIERERRAAMERNRLFARQWERTPRFDTFPHVPEIL